MSTSNANVSTPKRRRVRLQFSMFTMLVAMSLVSVLLLWVGGRYRDYLRERSMVVPTDWDIASGKNIKWRVQLGSVAYPSPVISGDKVFIGTNNAGGRLERYPAQVDLGVLLCFRLADGELLWQASSEKLPTGRVNDWPLQGVCSRPLVDGDRLWYVTNRCEVVCLDTDGFGDGTNDGPYEHEPSDSDDEADVVWKLDMIGSLDVFPRNMSACSVMAADELLLVNTGNGVGPFHVNLHAPDAPSFLALDKQTGEILWTDKSPGQNILHGQWGSPTYAKLGGVPQAIFPGGDGWLYSFDVRAMRYGRTKLLWKFDCNPKASKFTLGGRGTRNYLLTAPTVYRGLVFTTVGQDPEHGEGPGHVWCIDPTRRGDVSSELVFNQRDPNTPLQPKRLQAAEPAQGDFVRPNPNSAVVWHYDSFDADNDGEIAFEERMHRSLSRLVIKDDLAFVTDFSGLVHCLDARTGLPHWTYDLLAATWSSPCIAAEHVYVCDEEGDVAVFRLSSDPKVAMRSGRPIAEINMSEMIYSTPVATNNVLYIATRRHLYAIAVTNPAATR